MPMYRRRCTGVSSRDSFLRVRVWPAWRAASARVRLSSPRSRRAAGNTQARDLVSYFVGQGVGLIDSVKSAGAVVQEFKEDFADAVEHMNMLMEE